VNVIADTVLFLDDPGEQRGDEAGDRVATDRRSVRESAGTGAAMKNDLVF